MKVTIDVKDRAEGDAVKRALDDGATRAFVVTIGLLLPLAPRLRARVLELVTDALAEPQTDGANRLTYEVER